MKLVFVDESGTSKGCPFFILSILVIDESVSQELDTSLSKIKSEYNIPPHIEIKWNLNKTNKQLRENNMSEFSRDEDKVIKSKIVDTLCEQVINKLSIFLYLSPRDFFISQKWRSYNFAMNKMFGIIKDELSSCDETGIVLIDEISGLGVNKQEARLLIEDYIHTFKLKDEDNCMPLMLPNVISSLSFGHQYNDIVAGLINNYLISLHRSGGIRSQDVIDAIRQLKVYIPSKFEDNPDKVYWKGVCIYPMHIYKEDLKAMLKKTYDNLKKDFNFQ